MVRKYILINNKIFILSFVYAYNPIIIFMSSTGDVPNKLYLCIN